MTPSENDPPEDVPEEIADALEESTDRQLREIIHYAQQRLQEHPPITEAIEARAGEELVRTEDHDDYTLVVVERPDAPAEARGPFAYRVRWQPNVDSEEGEGKYQWHYLGKVHD